MGKNRKYFDGGKNFHKLGGPYPGRPYKKPETFLNATKYFETFQASPKDSSSVKAKKDLDDFHASLKAMKKAINERSTYPVPETGEIHGFGLPGKKGGGFIKWSFGFWMVYATTDPTHGYYGVESFYPEGVYDGDGHFRLSKNTDRVIEEIQRVLTPTKEQMDERELVDISGHIVRQQSQQSMSNSPFGPYVRLCKIGTQTIDELKYPALPASRADLIIADDVLEVAITTEDMKQSFHDMAHVTARQVADQMNEYAKQFQVSCSLQEDGSVEISANRQGTLKKADSSHEFGGLNIPPRPFIRKP